MFQALIHYKNNEEDKGPEREEFWEALADLKNLCDKAVESEDGFDPEDVQFAQVDNMS